MLRRVNLKALGLSERKISSLVLVVECYIGDSGALNWDT